MLRTFKTILFLLVTLLFLSSCSLENLMDEPENKEIEPDTISISELEDTDTFRNGALEHILEGELNGKGKAVGFHYDGLASKKGEVISGTKTDPNEFGVYEAKVEVSGVAKASNSGKSTFFPDDWNAQQVVDAINEAYASREYITGNTYEGLTKEGQVVRMYLDQSEQIISAFPVY